MIFDRCHFLTGRVLGTCLWLGGAFADTRGEGMWIEDAVEGWGGEGWMECTVLGWAECPPPLPPQEREMSSRV